jgi:hypothetical protein
VPAGWAGHHRLAPRAQVGLLQTPTAVAVTNPCVVLAPEAGLPQLSAFDLAVDGAGQIYLLYYTGDASQPDDYHADPALGVAEPSTGGSASGG